MIPPFLWKNLLANWVHLRCTSTSMIDGKEQHTPVRNGLQTGQARRITRNRTSLRSASVILSSTAWSAAYTVVDSWPKYYDLSLIPNLLRFSMVRGSPFWANTRCDTGGGVKKFSIFKNLKSPPHFSRISTILKKCPSFFTSKSLSNGDQLK